MKRTPIRRNKGAVIEKLRRCPHCTMLVPLRRVFDGYCPICKHPIAKAHKYRAKATTIDGHAFPSRAEAGRYGELQLLEKAGAIRNLKCQPSFSLDVNGVHIANYRADFRYVDVRTGVAVIEDKKGLRTDVYRIKKRLMKACLGIDVQEP